MDKENEMQAKAEETKKNLKKALKEIGLEWDGPEVGGEWIPIEVRIDRKNYSHSPTGKLRIRIESFLSPGRGQQRIKYFPEPKAGFDYKKIAGFIKERVEAKKERYKRNLEFNERKAATKEVVERINGNSFSSFGYRVEVSDQGKLLLFVHKECTEDQAVKVLRFVHGVFEK